MRYTFFIIYILSTFFSFSQDEKRLALVIGNSEYTYLPKLPNPVNDADLIAEKLDSLNFDVILAKNLLTARDMKKKIAEFGNKRKEYDVGYIFYAGHGVEVSGNNYLLPTDEDFKSDEDVINFGVPVESIIMYLTKNLNQVNILVLDACRNNPIWENSDLSRSSSSQSKGGLARMQVAGTLVAFSTDAGNVAADGKGNNSIYSSSLAKNMMLYDTSLDQVFRNVRREVLQEIPTQKPMEWSQLTGDEFFLRKTDLSKELDQIEFFDIALGQLDEDVIIDKIQKILRKDEKNIRALYLLADMYYDAAYSDEVVLDVYNNIIKLNPDVAKPYFMKGEIYGYFIEDRDLAFASYNKAIDLEPNNPECYSQRGYYYNELGDYENAIKDFSKAILLDPKHKTLDGDDIYSLRANVYSSIQDYNNAIKDYRNSIELNGYKFSLNDLALIYSTINEPDSAIAYFDKAIDFEPDFYLPYRNKAIELEEMNKFDLSEEAYTRAIDLSRSQNNFVLARSYYLRGKFYDDSIRDYQKAIEDYSMAIDLNPDNSRYYFSRAWVYGFELEKKEFEKAIQDFTRANDLDPDSANMNNIGTMLRDNTQQYNRAIYYYDLSIQMDSLSHYGYRNKGVTYVKMGDYDKAFENFNKAIELDSTVVYNYELRAEAYEDVGELDKAVDDYSNAIKFTEDEYKYEYYYRRGGVLLDFIDDENISKGIDDLKKSFQSYPFQGTLNNIAVGYRRINELDSALVYYDKAIALDSSSYLPYRNKAEIYRNQKKYNLAEDAYTKAIENITKLNSSNDEIAYSYSLRGKFYEDYIGNYQKAIEDYSMAIDLNPDNSRYYFSRAWVYGFELEKKEFEKAIQDFTRANDLDPDSANMNNIGTMLRDNTQQYNRAIYYYDLSIQMDSLSHYGYRNKGVTYVKMGDYDKAFENFNKAIELDSTVVYNYNLRAEAYEDVGELDKAVDDYTSIIELVFDDEKSLSDALDYRGDIYSILGLYDKSINDFIKSRDLFPDYFPTYNRLGDQHYNKRNIDSSLANYNKAIEIKDNFYSHLKKGIIFQNLDNYDQALAEFLKVIELKPETNSYFYLINLYISFDKFDKAIEISNKIMELSPEDPDIYYKRSLIYEKQKKYVKAIHDSNMSIARLGLGDYYIGSLDNSDTQLGMYDLYKHRISLYRKRNMYDFICEDLNTLRELIIKENLDESDMTSKLIDLEKFAGMSVNEIENCSMN